MNYKIVKGPSKYHVMYKKHWWSRWKYCRRPKGQAPNDNFAYVWQWDTERGAQAYINGCLKENMNEVLPQADVIGSVCPNCNAKGYRTTLNENSYACKKCGTWWVN